MRRAILILGGGTMQVPAIREAHTLDVDVHMADGNHRCPGASLVDHFHHIDLRDRDGLLRRARSIEGLAAVFTAATDFSASVAWISEALGLPGIPFEASMDATDKGRMRTRLAEAGVRIPRFRVIGPNLSVSEGGRRSCWRPSSPSLGLPLVCKPVDNMGARGVRLARRICATLAAAVDGCSFGALSHRTGHRRGANSRR